MASGIEASKTGTTRQNMGGRERFSTSGTSEKCMIKNTKTSLESERTNRGRERRVRKEMVRAGGESRLQVTPGGLRS